MRTRTVLSFLCLLLGLNGCGEPEPLLLEEAETTVAFRATSSEIQTLIDDMAEPHVAYPHGVPNHYHWAYGPAVSYGNHPPADWTAMTSWGQVYAPYYQKGKQPRNTRFQIRNLQTWYLSKSDDRWHRWQRSSDLGGANYREDFVDDVNIPADIRQEGEGISSTIPPGYNFHFWVNTGRVTIDPADVAGVWSSVEARLILDDPNRRDDRDKAQMMMGVGSDYWKDLAAPWDQWKTNGDIGIGRFRFITNDWQQFNMHTLTEQQIRDNPPPVGE